jgi:hypothetical protein
MFFAPSADGLKRCVCAWVVLPRPMEAGNVMKIVVVTTKFIALRFAVLSLGLSTMLCAPIFAQNDSERLWIAGRYDGSRVVVYFNKVQFAGTMSSKARKIASPVADAFFRPVELPASYVVGFQKTANAEHFSIGDRYDLMLGNGTITTIRLTTLVGCENDVGNDSFIGALGTVEQENSLVFTKGYYAVRRHHEPPSAEVRLQPKTTAEYLKHASLVDEPVRFDIETQIAALLDQRMKTEATDAEQRLAGNVAPALKVQPFRVADGNLRYYVRAVWKSGKETGRQHPYALAAWMTPLPTLHVLAVEKRTTGYGDFGVPDLLNVVDLAAGRTGIIVHIGYDARIKLDLAEYRDGVSTQSMRVMQSLSAGE